MNNLKGNESFKKLAMSGAILICLVSSGCHQPGHGLDVGGLNSKTINIPSSSANITNISNSTELMKTETAQIAKSQTDNLIAAQQLLEASIEEIPTLTAVGYAVVSTQPGRSDAQKRLMAIRAARMAAMRDLAEQIHGLQVDSNTTVIDLMVQNDTFRGVVSGTIRGARTVRINPTGADTYEIVLEIDREMMTYLLSVARQA